MNTIETNYQSPERVEAKKLLDKVLAADVVNTSVTETNTILSNPESLISAQLSKLLNTFKLSSNRVSRTSTVLSGEQATKLSEFMAANDESNITNISQATDGPVSLSKALELTGLAEAA